MSRKRIDVADRQVWDAFQIVKLSRRVGRRAFDCGHVALNQYLSRFALQNQQRHLSVTYVVVPRATPESIAGFYAVSTAQFAFQEAPAEIQRRLPRYPIPALRLAQLGVDLNFQGNALGELMLGDVIARALPIREQVGLALLVVDAIDQQAAAYYRHLGFLPFAKENKWEQMGSE